MAVAIILSPADIISFNIISTQNPNTIAANIALKFPESAGVNVNRLRALAVTSEQRSQALQQVPTMVEAGVKGSSPTTWWAILVPKGTPQAVITRLNNELAQIVKQPDVQERYSTLGLVTLHTPPERVTEWVKEESPLMGKVLKAAGVEPE